jgi:hypothetical protein
MIQAVDTEHDHYLHQYPANFTDDSSNEQVLQGLFHRENFQKTKKT